MIFTYCAINKSVYAENIDENIETGETFDYEVSNAEIFEAIVDFVYQEYFTKTDIADRCDYASAVKKGIRKLIQDFDLFDDMVEAYEDKFKDYFEDEAMENHIGQLTSGEQ